MPPLSDDARSAASPSRHHWRRFTIEGDPAAIWGFAEQQGWKISPAHREPPFWRRHIFFVAGLLQGLAGLIIAGRPGALVAVVSVLIGWVAWEVANRG